MKELTEIRKKKTIILEMKIKFSKKTVQNIFRQKCKCCINTVK